MAPLRTRLPPGTWRNIAGVRGSGRTRAMVMALPASGAYVVVHNSAMVRYVGHMIAALRPDLPLLADVRCVLDRHDVHGLYDLTRPVYLDHAFEEQAPPHVWAAVRARPNVLGLDDYAPRVRTYSFADYASCTATIAEMPPRDPPVDLAAQVLDLQWRMIDAMIAPPVVLAVDPAAPDGDHTVSVMTYRGVPVRMVDELLPGEALVVGPEMTAREVDARQREAWGDSPYVSAAREQNALLREWFLCRSNEPAAQERGRKLLREWLSPEQLASLDAHKHFEVRGQATGTRYRIREGTSINIDELTQDGAVTCRWCFAPRGGLVAGDVMLAQKIALETDEIGALKVANRHEASDRHLRFDVRYVC